MFDWDSLLQAAIIAVVFLAIFSTFVQKRWHIYDLFLEKKYTFGTHVALMMIAIVQLIAVTVLQVADIAKLSLLTPFGVVICVGAILLFVKSVQETGVKSVFHGTLFKRKQKKPGELWEVFTEPLYASYVLFYTGLALAITHPKMLISAAVMAVGLTVLAYLVPREP